MPETDDLSFIRGRLQDAGELSAAAESVRARLLEAASEAHDLFQFWGAFAALRGGSPGPQEVAGLEWWEHQLQGDDQPATPPLQISPYSEMSGAPRPPSDKYGGPPRNEWDRFGRSSG